MITLFVYGLSLSSALYNLQVNKKLKTKTMIYKDVLPGKTKVSKFDLTLVIDENVATFDVAMEEVSIMTICQTFHNLLHD